MLKLIGLLALLCIGGVVVAAIYVAWRITKMGQMMGGAAHPSHHDTIITSGTTITDDSSNALGYSNGDSVGSDVGSYATDFGSSDSSSSDSGGADSGGDSGGSSD